MKSKEDLSELGRKNKAKHNPQRDDTVKDFFKLEDVRN